MSDLMGVGSIIQAATDLAKYVIGVNTHTDTITNGGSQQNQDVVTDLSQSVNARSNTVQNTNTTKTTNTATDSDTKTTDIQQNTADPEIIKALKNLASQAISNSTDSSKTTDLLSGIIQKAGDAMANIFGQQKQAGIYNSASAQSMNNDLISRAAGDAASAILGYKVSQQQLADTSLNQVGNLTAGSTHTIDVANHTSGTSTENTNSTVTTDVNNQTDTNARTHVASETGYLAMSETKGNSKTGMSIVCTWM